MTRKQFNLIMNDILSEVKPLKLRTKIGERLLSLFDDKETEIEILKSKLRAKIGDMKCTDIFKAMLECGLLIRVTDKNEETEDGHN